MHLYFVRHGETLLNAQGVYYGATDTPLNARGGAQAASVGRQLAGIAWDKVYISDKLRTRQTAQAIVGDALEQCLSVVPDLAELDFGQWEGLDNGAVRRQFPEDYERWCDDWLGAAPTGGEAFQDFWMRVKTAFERIVEDCRGAGCDEGAGREADMDCDDSAGGCAFQDFEAATAAHRDKNILICAHNGTLRVIFAVMCGLGPEGTWHFNFEQDTWSRADYEYGNFTIRKMNTSEHA